MWFVTINPQMRKITVLVSGVGSLPVGFLNDLEDLGEGLVLS